MTVRDLVLALIPLAFDNPDAIVTIGHGPGPLIGMTPTVNGYVILDAQRGQ